MALLLNRDDVRGQGCRPRFTEDCVLSPCETWIQLRDSIHFINERHLIHEISLKKVSEVVGFIKRLEYGEAEELAQLFKGTDFGLLVSLVNLPDDVLDLVHNPFVILVYA